MNKLELRTFTEMRRERLLDYKAYEHGLETSALRTFQVVGEGLKRAAQAGDVPVVNLMRATRQRAWQSVDHLANCYSAGHDLAELRLFYPSALDYWESYAHYSKVFKESSDGQNSEVGHVALGSEEYHYALVLVCFSNY